MKSKIIKSVALTTFTIALASTVHAVPITGVIGFSGTANVDSPVANTSTEVLSWGPNTVGVDTGTFASLGSAAVVALASPWFYESGAINNFWIVSDGLESFTFNLSSSSVSSTSPTSITVALVGTVMSNVLGLSPTTFSGNMTLQDPDSANNNGTFKYTESLSFGSVPDGGTTVLLLGGALTGLALLRRKFASEPLV